SGTAACSPTPSSRPRRPRSWRADPAGSIAVRRFRRDGVPPRRGRGAVFALGGPTASVDRTLRDADVAPPGELPLELVRVAFSTVARARRLGAMSTERSTPETYDGRRARRERGRQAVIDATLDLFLEGGERPTSEEVAARAGVSV